MEDFDFSVFETSSPSKQDEATLKNLVINAENMAELKQNIDELQGTLDQLIKQYNHIAQEIIPNMLDELGLKTFELKNGGKITVKDFMSGSLPKEEDKFNQAVDWLIDNDLESILKTDISMKFGKGQENFANNVFEMLIDQGYEPEKKYGVHPQTLYSAIRELVKSGEIVPFEMLGLYAGKKAEIKF